MGTSNHYSKGHNLMKNKLALLVSSFARIDRRHIKLAFVVLTLAMLVLGAGAPADGPGGGN
jgi:hypothetical protein